MSDKESQEVQEGYIYFTIRGGRQRQITKEEWELEWLRWWERQKSKDQS